MKCISCNNPQPEYSFRVLEVHTLHVRDFGGEKLIQALGETRTFDVCAACVSSEMRASLYPAGRILRRCTGFAGLFLAGIVMSLTLSLRDIMNALRVIGPLCVFVGVSGTIARVRDALAQRRLLAGMTEPEALKLCAWQCVLKSAPKKYEDNDITYIPVDDAESLAPEELAVKYNLLPPISRKVRSKFHE
ncbi:MAG: hypothetical protein IJT02_00095 [Synergistaceae bacterium]|nr:hypothetical protein [Synergistaceae bacterium]